MAKTYRPYCPDQMLLILSEPAGSASGRSQDCIRLVDDECLPAPAHRRKWSLTCVLVPAAAKPAKASHAMTPEMNLSMAI
jgi:hypothetical protein